MARPPRPYPFEEAARLYRTGTSLKVLVQMYRVDERRLRRELAAAGIALRGWGKSYKPPPPVPPSPPPPPPRPAKGGLTEQEVQRLRAAIGYHPSWVDRPEYEYDRSYDDARKTPHPTLVEADPQDRRGRGDLGSHAGACRWGGGICGDPGSDRLQPGGVDRGQTGRDLGVHGCACPDRQPHPQPEQQPEPIVQPEPVAIPQPEPEPDTNTQPHPNTLTVDNPTHHHRTPRHYPATHTDADRRASQQLLRPASRLRATV